MASTKEYITSILEKNEIRVQDNYLQEPDKSQFEKSKYLENIKEVYKDLGGLQQELPLNCMPYDIQTENAIIILDNETTYNRYRNVTLRSPLYDEIKNINIENHKRYCRQYEGECVKSAGNVNSWSNSESEKHFGRSQEIGDLAAPGSSLWKLNAFKNYLTDVSALINKTTIFRVSPYDNLMINSKLIKIKDLLLSRKEANENYLLKYVQRGIMLNTSSK